MGIKPRDFQDVRRPHRFIVNPLNVFPSRSAALVALQSPGRRQNELSRVEFNLAKFIAAHMLHIQSIWTPSLPNLCPGLGALL